MRDINETMSRIAEESGGIIDKVDDSLYTDCTLCPRKCHADRSKGYGFCGVGSSPKLAKAMLHKWEEPCLAGSTGCGAVFFSGCTLKCIYCQNYDISHECFGIEVSTDRLADIILRLQEEGAATLEFITASQYIPSVINALDKVKYRLHIPTVFNCGGYESFESIRLLDGYIDIYMPDVKYYSDELAMRLSAAPHYFDTAAETVSEMLRQTGRPEFMYEASCQKGSADKDSENKEDAERVSADKVSTDKDSADKNSTDKDSKDKESNRKYSDSIDCENDGLRILKKGVLIRHLVLPNCRHDSIALLDKLAERLDTKDYLISLMSQYTPFYKARDIKDLNRRITSFEYDSVVEHALKLGFDGFMQEKSSAKEEYTPVFDLSGLMD